MFAVMVASLSNLLGPNLLLLVGIVILMFGGKKIPDLARGIRSSIKEFKRGKQEGEEQQPDIAKPAKDKSETPR
jgi:sec-independent protein translocase protein TatA